MKKIVLTGLAVLATGTANAENIVGVDRFICSAAQAQICLETGDCYAASPWEIAVPDFVVIDLDKKTVSTTESSGEDRSTEFSEVSRADGLIHLQGVEGGRAFSFVIHEITGRLTAAVARDGLSVTVFGACTNADI
ncbi:MAG: hypothetical protein GTO71_11530 [Woeseiaceae bacterium]|nr:hypothetical protein [Woeseiaceae bacterium]NIP21697.1 hypothetical protein [Woeseiaceae bacterium]NIS90783.1 hypothetical protein [Woeseiaceae bacterium]